MKQAHVLVPLTEAARQYRGPNGSRINLTLESTILGRNIGAPSPAAVALPVGWFSVSGKHCRIFCDEDGWYVEDLSRNGTFVNRKKVPKICPQPLATGDKLLLGPAIPQKADQDIEFQFQELPAEQHAKESSPTPTPVKRKTRDDISEAASVKRVKSQEPAQTEHLMQTIRDLQRQNREQLARFEKDSEASLQRIRELEGTLAAKNAALSTSQSALEEARVSLAKQEEAARTAASVAEEAKAQLLQRLQKAEAQQATTQDGRTKQINSLKATNARLSTELRDAQQLVSSLKEELRLSEEVKLDLEGQLDEAEKAVKAAADEAEDRLKAAERAVSDAKAMAQGAERNVAAANAKVDAEVKARLASEAIVGTLKADLDSAKQGRQRVEERESALRADLRLREGALARLREACAQLSSSDAHEEEERGKAEIARLKAEEAEKLFVEVQREQAEAWAAQAEALRVRQSIRSDMELQLRLTAGSPSDGGCFTAQTSTSPREAADETMTELPQEGAAYQSQDRTLDTQILMPPLEAGASLPRLLLDQQQLPQQALSSARAVTRAASIKGSQRSSQRLAAKQASLLPNGIAHDDGPEQLIGSAPNGVITQAEPASTATSTLERADSQRRVNGTTKASNQADGMDVNTLPKSVAAESPKPEASDRTSASGSPTGNVDIAVGSVKEPQTPPDVSLFDPNANPQGVTPISKKSRVAVLRASGVSVISDSDQEA